MSEQKDDHYTESDQRRDAMLLGALRKPPEPRPKRKRIASKKARDGET